MFQGFQKPYSCLKWYSKTRQNERSWSDDGGTYVQVRITPPVSYPKSQSFQTQTSERVGVWLTHWNPFSVYGTLGVKGVVILPYPYDMDRRCPIETSNKFFLGFCLLHVFYESCSKIVYNLHIIFSQVKGETKNVQWTVYRPLVLYKRDWPSKEVRKVEKFAMSLGVLPWHYLTHQLVYPFVNLRESLCSIPDTGLCLYVE